MPTPSQTSVITFKQHAITKDKYLVGFKNPSGSSEYIPPNRVLMALLETQEDIKMLIVVAHNSALLIKSFRFYSPARN